MKFMHFKKQFRRVMEDRGRRLGPGGVQEERAAIGSFKRAGNGKREITQQCLKFSNRNGTKGRS